MTQSPFGPWIPTLLDIVDRAGQAILDVYESDFSVVAKADASPLTQADLAAHKVIVDGLTLMTPDIPVISEESEPPGYEVRKEWDRYWLVDPLDGTKEFVNRNGEFTVNIALIEGQHPILGVVGVPVQQKIYVGDVGQAEARVYEQGNSRLLSPQRRDAHAQSITVVASRSHGGDRLASYLEQIEARFSPCERRPVGSSLKLCVLAEGLADIYPRLGPTSEWDIGAAQAVLEAAGGAVLTADGASLPYNSKESLLNPEFLAVSDGSFDWLAALPGFPDP